MKAGTIVQLPDGRIGTVVYHGLDGYGIVWGRLYGVRSNDNTPRAMLRDDYPSATIPCVGEEYEIIDPLPIKNVNNFPPPPMSKAKHTPLTCGKCEFAKRWKNDHAECSKYSSNDEIKIVAKNDPCLGNWSVSPLTVPNIGTSDVIIEGTHLGRTQEMCTVHVLYSPQRESEDSAQDMPDEIATINLINNILASPALLSVAEETLEYLEESDEPSRAQKIVMYDLRTAINDAKPKDKE